MRTRDSCMDGVAHERVVGAYLALVHSLQEMLESHVLGMHVRTVYTQPQSSILWRVVRHRAGRLHMQHSPHDLPCLLFVRLPRHS